MAKDFFQHVGKRFPLKVRAKAKQRIRNCIVKCSCANCGRL